MKELITIPRETIISKIYFIRGKKVMLDKDLSNLYQVSTGNLNLAVKRNIYRFPADFMFRLSKEEYGLLVLQNAIPSWGGSRYYPNAFTEQGIAIMINKYLKYLKSLED